MLYYKQNNTLQHFSKEVPEIEISLAIGNCLQNNNYLLAIICAQEEFNTYCQYVLEHFEEEEVKNVFRSSMIYLKNGSKILIMKDNQICDNIFVSGTVHTIVNTLPIPLEPRIVHKMNNVLLPQLREYGLEDSV